MKDTKLKKLEQEIRILQIKLKEVLEKTTDSSSDGIVIFRPAGGVSIKDVKKMLENDLFIGWSFLSLDKRLTPTLLSLYERIEKLKDIAKKDPLTGVGNRKAFFEVLTMELERSYRNKHPLCLLFIDIDDFKKINDTMGHNVGDRVLIGIADVLKKQCRKTDSICRYGGEEFVVLLPATSLIQGEITAQRIREGVKDITFSANNHTFHITCSIGICCYKGKKKIDPELLIKKADEAMYRAKELGKNRVVSAGIVDIDIKTVEEMVKVHPEEKNFLFGKIK